ncbi:hypothetical protein [Bacillus thuringiensis]|uniref:Uncharacterized protein n=1 Tax=Bacillus thuringiensis TaxID=1428 RepID=A0A9X6VCW1_BACTU|nr:hypothetical protein [Bacillus thuringiensis]MEC3270618.1 hypothetical protein [Bacillus thuringiensis]PFB08151.1 hypothetical protein CN398_10580 [Bacillus thuringiensis]
MNKKIVIMEYSDGQISVLFEDKTRRIISRGELGLIKLTQQHRKNPEIEYMELNELEVIIRLSFIRRFIENNALDGSMDEVQLKHHIEKLNFYQSYGIISDEDFEGYMSRIKA